MIQLYKSTNTNHDMNGDYTLSPLSCTFECNLNDTWLLTIENPIDNSLEDFTIGAVVSAPTPYGDKQLFRIYDVSKDDDGIIASAFPIFLDARNDCFLWDVRPSNVTGQTALNQMITNKKYSASSNIAKTSTAYYVQKNLIEALNGDDDNAFLKRWGGEIAYNNYEIIVNDRIGSDNGLKVEFGFNLLGVEEKINNEELVTRIIPKAYNGYILPNNETVDSPLISNYPIVYTRVLEYQDIKLIDDAQEDDAENGITVCNTLEELYAALRTRANKEFENGIDLPQITYNVDMVDLSKTDLYKDYKDLLTVNLGDTVHVKHRKLGIETSARVITLTYDCITQKVESLVLGDYEANYFNSVSSITHSVSQIIDKSNNSVMANKIQGVINLLKTSLKAQKDASQLMDIRAILFEDLNTDSPLFGAMSLGTQGLQISKKRTDDGKDWIWGTAINFESINADYILAGILQGIEIICEKGRIGGMEVDGQLLKYSAPGYVTPSEGKQVHGTMSIVFNADGSAGNNIYSFKFVTDEGVTYSDGYLSPDEFYSTNIRSLGMSSDNMTVHNYLYAKTATIDELNNSSSEDLKTDIRKYEDGALQKVLNTDVYKYKLKSQVSQYAENIPEYIGFIIGDKYNLTEDVLVRDGNCINLYSAIALLYKAIQEMYEEVKKC